MMKCGHAANAKRPNGDPCCAICSIFTDDAYVIVETPELKTRMAECPYCHKKEPSTTGLAFFKHWPERTTDEYYDGCLGWD